MVNDDPGEWHCVLLSVVLCRLTIHVHLVHESQGPL